METLIRTCQPADSEAVVELALRAWGPVFGSLEQVLGREMFVRLHGSRWEDYQRAAVRGVLADPGMNVWVAEAGAAVAGFATRWLRKQGMRVARYFKNL
jgi:hypothetical protein